MKFPVMCKKHLIIANFRAFMFSLLFCPIKVIFFLKPPGGVFWCDRGNTASRNRDRRFIRRISGRAILVISQHPTVENETWNVPYVQSSTFVANLIKVFICFCLFSGGKFILRLAQLFCLVL